MYKLSKTFRFEAAHRLVKGYVGKCNHPHGHSWKVEIVVEGENLNQHGMLCDFKDIKVAAAPMIEELDHSFLIYKGDTETESYLLRNKFRHIIFDDNPTSEVIAKWLCEEIEPRLPHGVLISEININETCTSKCSYSPKSEIFSL